MKVSHSSSLLARGGAISAIVVVCAAFGALLFAMNGAWSVVRIEGDLSAAERLAVQKAIEAPLESGYLTVDLDEVSRAVLGLSWPRAVAVRRVWPSALLVEVRKEAVAARWGERAALSSSGEVIEVPQPLGEEYPVLQCAHADGIEAMHVYQLLRDGLRDTDLEIARLEENDFGEWRAEMKNGLVVLFGATDLNRRLERFASVYRATLSARIEEVATADARYGNGVAVNWESDAQRDSPCALARPAQGCASSDREHRLAKSTPPVSGQLQRALAVND